MKGDILCGSPAAPRQSGIRQGISGLGGPIKAIVRNPAKD